MERSVQIALPPPTSYPNFNERELSSPRLVFDDLRAEYWLQCPYDSREIPKSLGFTWDAVAKRWTSKDHFPAFAALQYADDHAKEKIQPALDSYEKEIELSRATTSEFEPPHPPGLNYLPYQKAGIAYAYKRQGVLIADDMGLGKTIQAIGLINLIASEFRKANPLSRFNQRWIIICPASLKLNWLRELSKWLDKSITYALCEKGSWSRGANVLVINYDILHNYVDRFGEFDGMVLDEAHYVKNDSARRSKMVSQIKAKRKVLLSGTPIENKPAELFPLLHLIDPETYSSPVSFWRRYCGGVDNLGRVQKDGASNLDELNARLRSTVMIRRMKREVLTELPAKRRQIIEFPANTADLRAVIAEEKRQFEAHEHLLQPLREAINAAHQVNDTAAYAQAVKRFRAESFKILGHIAAIRRETAVAKIPILCQFLQDCLDQSFKVVVFAHHHDVMSALAHRFQHLCVSFNGRMSIKDKQYSVDRFQEDPKAQLFIGSLRAASLGITLTASSHAVFAELDWVPGVVIQAEDRLNRLGQKNSVLIQHTVLQDSLDYKIATQLIAKQEIIERAIDIKEAPPEVR